MIRVALGILAAIVAALVVDLKLGDPLINGITIALAVYLVTYYLLKWQFLNKVEKPTKNIPWGMGMAWLVVSIIYILVVMITVGTLEQTTLSKSLMPVSLSAGNFLGQAGLVVMSIAAISPLPRSGTLSNEAEATSTFGPSSGTRMT